MSRLCSPCKFLRRHGLHTGGSGGCEPDMERVVSGLRSLIEGPLATGSDRAEELNGRGLEANRHGDTSAALGFFLEAHVRGLFPSPRG